MKVKCGKVSLSSKNRVEDNGSEYKRVGRVNRVTRNRWKINRLGELNNELSYEKYAKARVHALKTHEEEEKVGGRGSSSLVG